MHKMVGTRFHLFTIDKVVPGRRLGHGFVCVQFASGCEDVKKADVMMELDVLDYLHLSCFPFCSIFTA
jgi:hypothetical protein